MIFFSSMIKQVQNSLTVHDNSWTLEFDNFFDFQNVISDSPPFTPERHYDALRTKIDMWLTPTDYVFNIIVTYFNWKALYCFTVHAKIVLFCVTKRFMHKNSYSHNSAIFSVFMQQTVAF